MMPRCLAPATLILLIAAGVAADNKAAEGLVKRVAGEERAAKWFRFETIDKDVDGKEVMGLGSQDGKVVLIGSGSISLASAFNWYLNDYLNTTYDWSTYEAIFPEVLPLPPSQNLSRVVKLSYHLNVCTYGYTLAFVDWPYWEKHIDWMAMQGINLPLAFLGQEKVIERTFTRFNVSFEELQHFISGPAFLPWFRMGNLQAWGGPITQHWIDARMDLQMKVLSRMRSMGMKPVLPAFAGFLPPAFVQKHPEAKVTQSADWNNFPGEYGSVYLLESVDPMFQNIGKAFIEEQTKLYGTDHIYQCDTYNEMNPPKSDLDYLAASSKAVFSASSMWQTWLLQQ